VRVESSGRGRSARRPERHRRPGQGAPAPAEASGSHVVDGDDDLQVQLLLCRPSSRSCTPASADEELAIRSSGLCVAERPIRWTIGRLPAAPRRSPWRAPPAARARAPSESPLGWATAWISSTTRPQPCRGSRGPPTTASGRATPGRDGGSGGGPSAIRGGSFWLGRRSAAHRDLPTRFPQRRPQVALMS